MYLSMYLFMFYDYVLIIFCIYLSSLNNCLLMRQEMKDVKKGTPLPQRCRTRPPGRLRILAMEREGVVLGGRGGQKAVLPPQITRFSSCTARGAPLLASERL